MELVPGLNIFTRVRVNLVIFASKVFSWKSSGPVYQDVTTKAGYIMQAVKWRKLVACCMIGELGASLSRDEWLLAGQPVEFAQSV